MSRENVEALRDVYRRWAAGDWRDASIFDRFAVCVTPDPSPRAFCGLEAMSGYMRSFLESWDELRMDATRYVSAGDSVVVGVRRYAKGRGSGAELEDHAFHVWTFRGRSAVRMEVFDSESDALEAVDLSE